MRLTPCPECARHVRVDAGLCPFCGHSLPVPGSARAKVGAMILGAAAVSSLTGCPRPANKYGGPPPPVEQRDRGEPEAVEEPAEDPEPDVDPTPEEQPAR